jgi:hypothetical protein
MKIKLAEFNDRIAVHSNQIFATMGFFWFCFIFSLLPLYWPAMMPFVQYASSGVLQLIALPLLGVGTVLAARASDRLAKEQHDAVMDSHDQIKELLTILRDVAVEDLKIQHTEDDIVERLKRIEQRLTGGA